MNNCPDCNKTVSSSARHCPKCGAKFRSRGLAIVLALLLGNIGIHYFYTGHYLSALISILFCWTFIPAFIAVIQAIIYLLMSKEQFYQHCK